MDTVERGVLHDTTKPTDEEAGLSATKERYGSHSDDDTREVLRDGEIQIDTVQRVPQTLK